MNRKLVAQGLLMLSLVDKNLKITREVEEIWYQCLGVVSDEYGKVAFVEVLRQPQYGDFKPSQVIEAARMLQDIEIAKARHEAQLRLDREMATAIRPDFEVPEITPERKEENKRRLSALIREKFPNIDKRPGAKLNKLGGR